MRLYVFVCVCYVYVCVCVCVCVCANTGTEFVCIYEKRGTYRCLYPQFPSYA